MDEGGIFSEAFLLYSTAPVSASESITHFAFVSRQNASAETNIVIIKKMQTLNILIPNLCYF